MPLYDFKCPRCGNEKEALVKNSEQPVSCDVCSSGCFTPTLMRRQPSAPGMVQVKGFSSTNGYSGVRSFEKRHTTGRLAGITTKVTGTPEGFDRLHN